MEIYKTITYNIYKISIKLFPLVAMCLLFVCCVSNRTKQVLPTENPTEIASSAININTASSRELQKLPRVGAKTAQKIVDFRNEYGDFSRPEHLLLVEGVSEAHFREVRNLIKVK